MGEDKCLWWFVCSTDDNQYIVLFRQIFWNYDNWASHRLLLSSIMPFFRFVLEFVFYSELGFFEAGHVQVNLVLGCSVVQDYSCLVST